jgi:hypothetical protein
MHRTSLRKRIRRRELGIQLDVPQGRCAVQEQWNTANIKIENDLDTRAVGLRLMLSKDLRILGQKVWQIFPPTVQRL